MMPKKKELKSYTPRFACEDEKIKKVNKPILAWHFHNGYLGYGDGREVISGKVYSVAHDPDRSEYFSTSHYSHSEYFSTSHYSHPGQIRLCIRGLHASERIWDAYQFHQGPYLSRVLLRGWVGRGVDKLVATERKVLWTVDTRFIDKFDDNLTERQMKKAVLDLARKRRVKDPR